MTSEQDKSFVKLVEELKNTVLAMEIRDGKKPSFEDYIYEMIDREVISLNNLEMQMRASRLVWAGARLGKSNWKTLYDKIIDETSNDNFSSSNNEESVVKKSKETNVKTNKILLFIKALGSEVDLEIIKVIKNVGIIKLILGVVGFLLLRFLVLTYGSGNDILGFYTFSVIALGFFLTLFISGLKEGSKMRYISSLVIMYGGALLAIALVLGFGYSIVVGLWEMIKDMYDMVIELIS